jgi:hypothetical protein
MGEALAVSSHGGGDGDCSEGTPSMAAAGHSTPYSNNAISIIETRFFFFFMMGRFLLLLCAMRATDSLEELGGYKKRYILACETTSGRIGPIRLRLCHNANNVPKSY